MSATHRRQTPTHRTWCQSIVWIAFTAVAAAASPAPDAPGALQSANAPAVRTAARPDDGKGAFATGKYRNLFAEAGYAQREIDARIDRACDQLFYGDKDTQRLYTPAGTNENGPLAYIPDIQHTDVRSEGMSYGMMIAVQMDKKAEFDALWNWSMTYMYQKNPKHPTYGFFSWQMRYDGTVIDEAAGAGRRRVLRDGALLRRQPLGQRQGHLRLQGARGPAAARHGAPAAHHGHGASARRAARARVGKEVNDEHGMILFSPDERNTFTDPSYHLPAFYELWARWGPEEDRAFWARAATVSRDYYRQGHASEDRPRAEPRPVRRHAASAAATVRLRRFAKTRGAAP